MTQENLNAYFERKSEIEAIQEVLTQKQQINRELTRKDFGIAEGDTLTVDVILKLMVSHALSEVLPPPAVENV